MFLLDVLLAVLLFLAIVALISIATAAYLSMPLVDVLNKLLRRIGLAGPWRGSRTIGARGTGVIDEIHVSPDGARGYGKLLTQGELWDARCDAALAAELETGDEVEFVYEEGLVVQILRKRAPPRRTG